MGRLALLFVILLHTCIHAQTSTQIWTKSVQEVAVNELWPVVVHWEKIPFGPPYNLRLDASSFFTLLMAPATLDGTGGSATLWLSAAPFTPAGEHKLCVYLESTSSLLPPVSTCFEINVQPSFRVLSSLVDQRTDSVTYHILNEGNIPVLHGAHAIPPGEGRTIARRVSTEEELAIHVKGMHGRDTTVIMALREYVPATSIGQRNGGASPEIRYSLVQNSSAGKILSPRMRSTMRIGAHTLSLRNTSSQFLFGASMKGVYQDLRIGYDWFRPTPYMRSELTPFIYSQVRLSAFKLHLNQGRGVANYALEYQKNRAQGLGISSKLFFARSTDLWLPGGSLMFSLGHYKTSIYAQQGLAHVLFSNTGENRGTSLSGALVGASQTEVPFRNHINLLHYGRLHDFRYQANLSVYELPTGSWAQQASFRTVFIVGSWRSSAQILHHKSDFTTNTMQGQTGYEIGPLTAGVRTQFRSHTLYTGPFFEWNKGKTHARTICTIQPNGRIQYWQTSARVTATKGLSIWLNSHKNFSGPVRLSSTVTKNTNIGQLAFTLRPDASLFCSWRGKIAIDPPAKKIKAKCLDQNNRPVEGVEILVDGRRARSDAQGNLAWHNITSDTVSYRLNIASVPFGMEPQFNMDSIWHLSNQKMTVQLKFLTTAQIRGYIAVKSTSAFTPQVDFSNHHILLQSSAFEDRWLPIMADGSFVLTQLPDTTFHLSIHPVPKGFKSHTMQVTPANAVPSKLIVSLEEVSESIPFQAL